MPNVTVIISGPAHGVPAEPHEFACCAQTALEAIRHAARDLDLDILRDRAGSLAAGSTVYLNGADVRFRDGLETPLTGGDLLWLVCPATDT